MYSPLAVSPKVIPAANKIGYAINAMPGTPAAAAAVVTMSMPMVDAVSNPNPNNAPMRNTCLGSDTLRSGAASSWAAKPRGRKESADTTSSGSRRSAVRTLQVCARVTMLVAASSSRYSPDTAAPTSPSTRTAGDPESNRPRTADAPEATKTPTTMTTVEWPSENAKPTALEGRPSVTNLRVELSITEMWSKSKACITPRPYANTEPDSRMPQPGPPRSVANRTSPRRCKAATAV